MGNAVTFQPVRRVDEEFVPVQRVDFVPIKRVEEEPPEPAPTFGQRMMRGEWSQELMKQLESGIEIAGSTLASMAAYPIAKAYGTAGGLAGRDQQQAEQDVYKLIPQPKTEAGKTGAGIVAWPFEKLTKPARVSGDWLREKGYPNLAYAAESGLEVLAFMALGKGGKKVVGKIRTKEPWEKGKVQDFKTLEEAETKAAIKERLASPKERPLERLSRMEETLRAEAEPPAAANIWQRAQLAEKRFQERGIKPPEAPFERSMRPTHTTPLELAEAGFAERMAIRPTKEIWSAKEPVVALTAETGQQAKATRAIGGKPGIAERGIELQQSPTGEFGLKITDRKVPESKKRIAEQQVDAIMKRGGSAEDAAAVLERYLGPQTTQRGMAYLREMLGSERGAITIEGLRKTRKQALTIMDLIGKRRANLDKAMYDSAKFIAGIRRQLSEAELEAVPFIRQGIKDLKVLKDIGREDLIPIVKNAHKNKNLMDVTKEIGKYYDEAHQFLKDNWGEDLGFVNDYVTQLWDIPKNRRSEAVTYFTTNNPFLKKRSIPTLEEGIKLGLKPKTTNIARLLAIYDGYKVKTAYNMRFAKELLASTDEAGNPVLLSANKAPADWVTIDHPALNRVVWTKGKLGKSVGFKQAVKVHPDIANEVKIVVDRPFSHPAINAVETINAFLKKAMLSVSFFHHFALTEAAFATGVGRKAVALWNPARVYRALKHGDYDIFRNEPLAKDFIDHQGTFGALEDLQVSKVRRALEGLEKRTADIPGVRKATRFIRKGNELWDAALWDYYHNALKLYAYEHNVNAALKGKKYTPEQIEAIKTEMGKFVNDTFGGQNWDLQKVMSDPKVRQMAHWALLAPDWTISVLKQAASPAKGVYKMAKGEKMQGKALATRGSLFWLRAGLYYSIISQVINQYTTKRDYGEGRFTWENAPGNELNIYLGKNEDGTERYMRMGKQFREVLEWFQDPEKKLGSKLAPLTREAFRWMTKHDPGSGYPVEWSDKEFWSATGWLERGKSIAEMPLPFSLRSYVQSRPGSFMLTFPTRRGMTNYAAIRLFKKALTDKSREKVRRVFFSALENNLDAEELFRSAKSSVKADITFDNKTIAKELWQEFKQLKGQALTDAYKIYIKRGIITPEVHEQLNRIIAKERSVVRQKKQYGVK
jgi:hypothetical protein